MKINIASGGKDIDGYLNVDDIIYPLTYENLDEIRASHILEHFGHVESLAVLINWVDALKVGGILKIAVPDLDDLMRRRALGETWEYEGILMGGQVDNRDYHKSIWNYEKLNYFMTKLDLDDIKTWQSEIMDCAAYPFSLNLQGRKTWVQ